MKHKKLSRTLLILIAIILVVPLLFGCSKKIDEEDSKTLTINEAQTVTIADNYEKVIIQASGVVLENGSVEKIMVEPSVGDGQVTLFDIQCQKLFVQGGGTDSIYLKGNTVVQEIEAKREGGPVRIHTDETAKVKTLIIAEGSQDVVVTGSVDNLEVKAANVVVTATDAVLRKINIYGADSIVIIAEDTEVEEAIIAEEATGSKIIIKGTVKEVTVEGSDSEVEISGAVDVLIVTGKSNLIITSEVKEIRFMAGAEDSTILVKDGGVVKLIKTETSITTSGDGSIEKVVSNDAGIITGDIVPGETVIQDDPFSEVEKDEGEGDEYDTETKPKTPATVTPPQEKEETVTKYTVTFIDYNGVIIDKVSVASGADATGLVTPVRLGHTFTGWDKPLDAVTSDIAVNAVYEANKFSVTFNSNEGSQAADQLVAYGEKIVSPADPSKAGFIFDGWFSDTAFTSRWDFTADTMPAKDLTLYAGWEPCVSAISVITPPTKTTYTEGESLDLRGLVVELIKTDNSSENVPFADFASRGITTSVANGATLSNDNTKVTITHTESGKSVKQLITVNPAIPPESSDASVASVTVSGVAATVDAEDTTVYDVELPYGTDLSTLTASNILVTATDANATVADANTTDSGTTWTIVVTAEDGTTTATYTINVIVAEPPAQTGAPSFSAGTPATFNTELAVINGSLGITTTLTFTWYRSADNTFEQGTDTEVGTGFNYMPTADDIGKYLIVVVTTPDATGNGLLATAAVVAKADGPVAISENYAVAFPAAGTSISLTGLAANATGLEAAVAIDGTTYGEYATLTVDGSGIAEITGLEGVTSSTQVKVRVAETATYLAGEDKEMTTPTVIPAVETGEPVTDERPATYQLYVVQVDSTPEDTWVYRIKPDGTINKLEIVPDSDGHLNIYFRISDNVNPWSQQEGDHAFLVRKGNVWYKTVINYTEKSLLEQIESAKDYQYDPEYEYNGIFTKKNNYEWDWSYNSLKFDREELIEDIDNYLGALYYQQGSTIISIRYEGVDYLWNGSTSHSGSNWEYNGNTLVDALITELESDGIDDINTRQISLNSLTLSAQRESHNLNINMILTSYIFNELRGNYYETIQEAVTEATEGDNILLGSGEYLIPWDGNVGLKIYKSLNIIGEAENSVVIRPETKGVPTTHRLIQTGYDTPAAVALKNITIDGELADGSNGGVSRGINVYNYGTGLGSSLSLENVTIQNIIDNIHDTTGLYILTGGNAISNIKNVTIKNFGWTGVLIGSLVGEGDQLINIDGLHIDGRNDNNSLTNGMDIRGSHYRDITVNAKNVYIENCDYIDTDWEGYAIVVSPESGDYSSDGVKVNLTLENSMITNSANALYFESSGRADTINVEYSIFDNITNYDLVWFGSASDPSSSLAINQSYSNRESSINYFQLSEDPESEQTSYTPEITNTFNSAEYPTSNLGKNSMSFILFNIYD